MDDLKSDDLVIQVDRSVPSWLRLEWLGRSDSANPGQIIGPFFQRVLADAVEGALSIEMHFGKLQYFNSSTIATLIHLINLAIKAKVSLRIYYDAQLKWQALSFDALERAVHSFRRGAGPDVEFFPTRP